jgi:dihydroneopterin aldolase
MMWEHELVPVKVSRWAMASVQERAHELVEKLAAELVRELVRALERVWGVWLAVMWAD